MFYRHDDLIIRNGLYADMWYEQRTINHNDSLIIEDSVNPTRFDDFPIEHNYQHPHV